MFSIILLRWKDVALVFSLVVVLSVAYMHFAQREYTASATLAPSDAELNALSKKLNYSISIKIISAPYFIATKLEAFKDRGNGKPAGGKLLSAIQELATPNVAMDVKVKKIEQFLREVGSFLAFHGT